jgi:hypothetical protein
MQKERVFIPMTTLDFYKYEADGLVYYEFDATEVSAPEPMVNAMAALRFIKSKNERLVGKFFHEPTPLYAKIAKFFSYEATKLTTGDYKIIFKKL